MKVVLIFDLINTLTNFIPLAISLPKLKKLTNYQMCLIFLIIFLVFFEILNRNYFIPVLKNNRPLFWSYTIMEFAFIASAYSFASSSEVQRRAIRWLIVGFSLFAVGEIVFLLKPTDLNSLARSVETLLLITLALLYLRQLLEELRVEKLSRHPMFWLTVGVLVYFPGTFLLFATHNWFAASLPSSIHYQIWVLNDVANIIFNLFIAVALWLPPDQPQSPTSARL